MKSFKSYFFLLAVFTIGMFETKITAIEEDSTFTTSFESTPSDDEMKEYAKQLLENESNMTKDKHMTEDKQRKISHKLLGLDPTKQFNKTDIKKAHYKAMLRWHSDKNSNPEAVIVAKAINNAKDFMARDFSSASSSSSFEDDWTEVNPEFVDLHQKLISGLNDSVRSKLSTDAVKLKINDIFSSLTEPEQNEFIENLNTLEEKQPNTSIDDLISKAEDDAKINLTSSATGRAKTWWKNKNFKNFKNIFKSDKTILKEFIQKSLKSVNPESKINTDIVKDAVAKLSRSERMDLFNEVTHEELDDKKLGDRSAERAKTLFERNLRLFKSILPSHEMLTPIRDKIGKISSQEFEITNMRQINPDLSLAENAERMKKAQGLKVNTADLAKDMRTYLKENPSPQNLKALLVDATDTTRASGSAEKQEAIKNIFDLPGMKDQFDALSTKAKDQFITSITTAELRLKETNMNLAGSGAKVSYTEAERIFKENANVFEKYVGLDKILTPIAPTQAIFKNISNFTFETIDISKYKNKLSAVFKDPNFESPLYKEFKDQNPSSKISPQEFEVRRAAMRIKDEQNLKLQTSEIEKEITNYLDQTTLREVNEPEAQKSHGKWTAKTHDRLAPLFGEQTQKTGAPDLDELFPSATPDPDQLFPSAEPIGNRPERSLNIPSRADALTTLSQADSLSLIKPTMQEYTASLKLLGLDGIKFISPKDIDAAYKRLALQLHPDKGGDTQSFQDLGKAKEILTNLAENNPTTPGLILPRQ